MNLRIVGYILYYLALSTSDIEILQVYKLQKHRDEQHRSEFKCIFLMYARIVCYIVQLILLLCTADIVAMQVLIFEGSRRATQV